MKHRSSHTDLPRSDDIARLPFRLTDTLRRPARLYFSRRYDITIHDDHLLPHSGPVLLAVNHLGVLDGPFLVAYAPRMVHALVKREMFVGTMSRALHAFGQIPVERTATDPLAVRTALRVLRDGRVLAIYPEGTRGAGDFARIKNGVAYLAMVTGAPVVPLVALGTRTAGIGIGDLPPKGTRIDLVYGEPVQVQPVPFPRRQGDVRAVADQLHATLRTHVQKAVVATGNPLPGEPLSEELQ
ncbi:MAG TPA: lysophospholipid acyltransferase family protein [Kribbellaceae bacterium]|nr:lysophospholipid acyltransferase family protein [Kribbellaceae bacterium]